MNITKRAILYIARKWNKTLLVFFLLLAVAVLIMSSLAILDAQEQQTAQLRGVTGASFTVDRNLDTGKWVNSGENSFYNTQAYLSDEMIEAIARVEGISAYNASLNCPMFCYRTNGTALDLVDWGELENYMKGSEVDSISNMYGCTNSEFHDLFTSGKLELSKGSPILADSEHDIIMSNKAAADNGLEIGDIIKVTLNQGEPVIEFTITGLFDIIADEEDYNMFDSSSYFDYMQYSFISMASMKELLVHYKDEQECDSADFFVSDPEKLENIIQEVQRISSIDWNNYTITANDEVYQRVANSISDTSLLISAFIWVTVCVSMVILALLLSMWMRGRKWEIGILMAIGISKSSIILQNILETLLIAVFAFPCGYLISSNGAGHLGELLGTVAEGISVTGQHFGLVSGVGTILLILAVVFSCIPILRCKPREILSQME